MNFEGFAGKSPTADRNTNKRTADRASSSFSAGNLLANWQPLDFVLGHVLHSNEPPQSIQLKLPHSEKFVLLSKYIVRVSRKSVTSG